MAQTDIDQIVLTSTNDEIEIVLPDQTLVIVYGDGEVVANLNKSPWTEYSFSVIKKLKKLVKKDAKAEAARLAGRV